MKFKHLTVLIFALVFTFAAEAQLKIAYTNLELAMAYLPEVQNANTKVKTYQAQLEKQLKTKQNYFDLKYQEYSEAAQQPGASEESMAPLQKELEKLQQELQASVTNSENQIIQKQAELMEPILNKVQQELQTIADEKGYDYVLNSASSGSSVILHGSESFNITEMLLERLGVEIPKD